MLLAVQYGLSSFRLKIDFKMQYLNHLIMDMKLVTIPK